MSVTDLLKRVEDTIAASGHLVLLKAREQVGPCTYAQYIHRYVVTKTKLRWLEREWNWSRIPDEKFDADYARLFNEMELYHHAMYRQPCLLCKTCDLRSKLWLTAAQYNQFGTESMKPSQNPPSGFRTRLTITS